MPAGSDDELVAEAEGDSVTVADVVGVTDSGTTGTTDGVPLREGKADLDAPGASTHSVTTSRVVKSMVALTGVSS